VLDSAVADTGPILHLSEVGEARQLALFDTVVVSQQVKVELVRCGAWDIASSALKERLMVQRVFAREIREQSMLLSRFRLHRADFSTAALASRVRPDVVLTDDLTLRRALESQGHQVVGSIGVLFRAFGRGLLRKPELLSALDQVLDGSSLYTSKAFRTTLREIADSLPD